jgi:hypothetical protein
MTSMDMELEARGSMSDNSELAPEDGINETRLLARDSAMEIEGVAREGAREVAGVEFLVEFM